MVIDAKLVGSIIREYRKKSGKSQEVISGLAELDRTHYSKIERGDRLPTLVTFFKIASALEVPPHKIMMTIEHRIDTDV